jgi:hypothetical protein
MECFALGQEMLFKRPLYRAYTKNIYSKTLKTTGALEEAIANYVARESLQTLMNSWQITRNLSSSTAAHIMAFIDALFDMSPPGYRDWHLGRDPDAWRRLGCLTLRGQSPARNQLPQLETFLADMPQRLRLDVMPIWITTETNLSDRLFGNLQLRDVIWFLRRRLHWTVDENAPGDHKRAITDKGEKIQLNRARSGKEIDIASLKAIADCLGKPVGQLVREIKNC